MWRRNSFGSRAERRMGCRRGILKLFWNTLFKAPLFLCCSCRSRSAVLSTARIRPGGLGELRGDTRAIVELYGYGTWDQSKALKWSCACACTWPLNHVVPWQHSLLAFTFCKKKKNTSSGVSRALRILSFGGKSGRCYLVEVGFSHRFRYNWEGSLGVYSQ